MYIKYIFRMGAGAKNIPEYQQKYRDYLPTKYVHTDNDSAEKTHMFMMTQVRRKRTLYNQSNRPLQTFVLADKHFSLYEGRVWEIHLTPH